MSTTSIDDTKIPYPGKTCSTVRSAFPKQSRCIAVKIWPIHSPWVFLFAYFVRTAMCSRNKRGELVLAPLFQNFFKKLL